MKLPGKQRVSNLSCYFLNRLVTPPLSFSQASGEGQMWDYSNWSTDTSGQIGECKRTKPKTKKPNFRVLHIVDVQ